MGLDTLLEGQFFCPYGCKSRHSRNCLLILTNFAELGPSLQANNSSPTQEIAWIVLNTKVHYHVHKCPSLVHFLSQINPVHRIPFYFYKTHFTFPSIFMPSCGLFPSVVLTKDFIWISFQYMLHVLPNPTGLCIEQETLLCRYVTIWKIDYVTSREHSMQESA